MHTPARRECDVLEVVARVQAEVISSSFRANWNCIYISVHSAVERSHETKSTVSVILQNPEISRVCAHC